MHLLQATRESLLNPLQSVANIVDKRHTMPILSNVLLEKHGDALTVLATDVDIQITTRSIVAGGDGDGAVTVAARKFQDILRALPEGSDISLHLEENRLLLRAGRSRYTLQTLPADDFPKIEVMDNPRLRITLPQRVLKQKIALVQYAMAAQDIRYYLNGLLFVVNGAEVRLVATDGHRLGFASAQLEQAPGENCEVILPRKTILELARQLQDSDDAVEILLSGNQIVFRFGTIELVSKLIDGRFPDYDRVIPKNHQKQVVMSREQLQRALHRAAILTSDKFKGIRLSFSSNTLKIASSNTEHEEAEEQLEIDYSDSDIDIGFNVTYLLDVLHYMGGDNVQIRFQDSNNSALFQIPGSDEFKYVVMPMRI